MVQALSQRPWPRWQPPKERPGAPPWRPRLPRADKTDADPRACTACRLARPQSALARDAVDNLERLGPTFIKLGQIMSIR